MKLISKANSLVNNKYIIRIIVFLSYIYWIFNCYIFINKYSVNLLTWDHYDVFDAIVNESNLLNVFLWQHTSHRVGFGLVILKILAGISHWNTIWESYMILFALIAASIIFLVLKIRITKSLNIFDAVIPFIILTTNQTDILLHGFSLTYILPVLLLYITLLLFTINPNNLSELSIIFLGFIGIYTSFPGVFLHILIGSYFLLSLKDKDDMRIKLQQIVKALTVFSFILLYFFKYNFSQANYTLRLDIVDIIFNISYQINNVIGINTSDFGALIIPSLLSLGLLLILIYLKQNNNTIKIIFPVICLYVYAYMFTISTYFHRIIEYPQLVFVTRYIPHVIPIYLGTYIAINIIPNTTMRTIALLTFVSVIIFISSINHKRFEDIAKYLKSGASKWKECYLIYKDAQNCSIKTDFEVIRPERMDFLMPKLIQLEQLKLNIFYHEKDDKKQN